MATIAYKYRIRKVLSDEERVMDEICAAHRLYNDLVAIERVRRHETRDYWAKVGKYEDLVAQLGPEIEAAREAAKDLPKGKKKPAWEGVDRLRREIWELERATIAQHSDPAAVRRRERKKEIRAEYKARHGKKIDDTQLAALLDADPDCLSPRDRRRIELVKEYQARGSNISAPVIARKLREERLVGPTEHIEERARTAIRNAYANPRNRDGEPTHNVTWHTCDIVKEAFKRSLKDVEWREQDFSRWEGSGTFGVRTKGITLDELYGESTLVRLERLPDAGKIILGSRRSGRRHRLRVRIGSEGAQHAPVWADFEAIVDRPMDPEARINRVLIKVERVGLRNEWYAVFTADIPGTNYGTRPASPQFRNGKVAIDIGWRSTNGNVRVGYAVNADGVSEEFVLPLIRCEEGRLRPLRDRFKHAQDSQEMSERLFSGTDPEGILITLARWLGANADILPEWLSKEATSIHRCKSQTRFDGFVRRWLANRFDGDDEIVNALDAWRRTWRHLYDWECHERQHALASRREHYRLIAVDVARAYSTIIINDADLAATRRRKTADKAAELVMIEDKKRSQGFDAAPGELREEIVRAARKYGATVVPVAFDTHTCHACGALCAFDRNTELRHVCEHCGCEWDQDENACRNALLGRTPDKTARKPSKVAKVQQKTPKVKSKVEG